MPFSPFFFFFFLTSSPTAYHAGLCSQASQDHACLRVLVLALPSAQVLFPVAEPSKQPSGHSYGAHQAHLSQPNNAPLKSFYPTVLFF
jgi:hypothetical protein